MAIKLKEYNDIKKYFIELSLEIKKLKNQRYTDAYRDNPEIQSTIEYKLNISRLAARDIHYALSLFRNKTMEQIAPDRPQVATVFATSILDRLNAAKELEVNERQTQLIMNKA